MKIMFINSLIAILLFVSCSKGKSDDQKSGGKNFLSMKINGVEWVADSEIFGAFHPQGYNKAIIISGSKGPNDANENVFTLNIYETSGTGTYKFSDINTDFSVIQLGNYTPEDFIIGGYYGFDVDVFVTKASKNPDIIEATFSGTLKSNRYDVFYITEGKFYYHE